MSALDPNEEFVKSIHLSGLPDVRDESTHSVGYFNAALALIESGQLDYAWKNQDGRGVLRALLDSFGSSEVRAQVLEKMIYNGLNPLRAAPAELGDILDNKAMRTSLRLVLALMEEEGRGLRDDQGGNLYFSMARRNHWQLSNALTEVMRSQADAAQGRDPMTPWRGERAWVTQEQEDGSTLLHCLWNSDQPLEDIPEPNNEGERRVIEAKNLTVNLLATYQLVELGADLLKSNQSGVRAWDLIGQRDLSLRSGEMQEWKRLDAIFAQTEERLLSLGTPRATKPHKSGARL